MQILPVFFQLDEINQLFLPNMRQKIIWFYQEADEPESIAPTEQPKAGPSRAAGTSSSSKTPQGIPIRFAVASVRGHSIYYLRVKTGTTPAGPVVKHKLFITDGWECAFTGTCIYIFRLNTSKPLPEEGFQKDL